MARASAWTPYGLEHIRVRRNRTRRVLGLLALLLLLGLVSLLLSGSTTTTRDTQIFANGNKVSDNGILITPPEQQAQADHVTVGLTPGTVTSATTGSTTAASTVQRSSLPVPLRAAPYDWAAYMLLYGPYVLAGLAVLYFAKRKGKSDEVNYGVYKGAMPLEMITASHQGEVITRRHVKESVFGKRREDHLPRELATVEPAIVEEGG
jgi:hypothetical protein